MCERSSRRIAIIGMRAREITVRMKRRMLKEKPEEEWCEGVEELSGIAAVVVTDCKLYKIEAWRAGRRAICRIDGVEASAAITADLLRGRHAGALSKGN